MSLPLSNNAGDMLFAAGAVIAGIGVVLLFIANDQRVERRVFWTCNVLALFLWCVALVPRGWGTVVGFFVAFLGILTFMAYIRTPYLKIGGRIFAFSSHDARPDPPRSGEPTPSPPPLPHDSYLGSVTARKLWWLLAALVCGVAAAVYLTGWDVWTVAATCFVTALAAMGGIDDATRKLPAARGQRVQAFTILVASALLWAIPPIVYLVGYQIGKRRPMGYGLRDPRGAVGDDETL
ncbi:hypothetical protein [Mycolicibacterium thermoresistibile]